LLFLPTLRTLRSTLFPYTTLFRSIPGAAAPTGCAAGAFLPWSGSAGAAWVGHRRRRRRFCGRYRGRLFVWSGVLRGWAVAVVGRSEEHTSELQSREKLVCRLLFVK